MKILITGGGGFIGKALIKALLEREFQLFSLSRNSYPELEDIGIHQIKGNIEDKETVMQACKGIDVVFHIAAKVQLWGPYDEFYKTNVEGTNNIIQSCRESKVKYLIYTSSASVVFDGSSIEGGNESLEYPDKPVSNYTSTKAQAEKLVLKANNSKLKTISLRPHLVWGAGDTHLIPGILKRAKSGRLKQIGNNKYYVDITYIDNYTNAQLCALDTLMNNPKVSGKAFFITDNKPIKVWDFINALLSTYNIDPINKIIPEKVARLLSGLFELTHQIFYPKKEPFLTRFTVNELCSSHWFDISAARKELLYNPQISFEEGLKRLKG